MSFETLLLLIVLLWLAILSYFLLQTRSHYNKVTKGISTKTLKSILDELLHKQEMEKKDIDLLKERCDTIEKESLFSIRKIGLVRFNPFKDTGGDQSFILALLDNHNSGVVISGLYSRSGTRWYAKKIKKGKAIEHELSDEEKKAINTASEIKE